MVKITRHIITKRQDRAMRWRQFSTLFFVYLAQYTRFLTHLRVTACASGKYVRVSMRTFLRCVRRTLRTARLRKANCRRVKFPIKQHFEEIQGFSKSLSVAWTAQLKKAFFCFVAFSVNFWPSKTINPFQSEEHFEKKGIKKSISLVLVSHKKRVPNLNIPS